MKKKITTSILLAICILLASCNKDDAEENNAFDVLNYKQEFVTHLMIPAVTEFILDVKNLNEASANFVENTNEENASILKKLWIMTQNHFLKQKLVI